VYEIESRKSRLADGFSALLKDKGRSTGNVCRYRITVLCKACAEDAGSCYGFQMEKYAFLLELPSAESALNRDL